jgi:ribosomal protein L7Ae-like RNA K-turn-binding protein
MGLCKSRQQKPTYAIPQKMVAKEPAFRAPPGLDRPNRSMMRPDAQPFYPGEQKGSDQFEDDAGAKESWEIFLDNKKSKVDIWKTAPIRPDADGSFTSRYQGMLSEPGRRPRRKENTVERDFDILQSWRNAAPKVNTYQFADDEKHQKKRKTTSLKKQILAQRSGPTMNPLWMKFADQLQRVKEENGSTLVESHATKDDIDEQSKNYVPFGLADRCYLSDTEDASKTQRHAETSHALIRDYVDTSVTLELESAVTACLFRLRQLKKQDLGIDRPTPRYAIGFREVSRLLQNKSVSALIIAPDVEETSGGALENKIAALKKQSEQMNVPVIFALSRRQLGSALQKNVSISVLAMLETRGAEESFEEMLAEAKRARDVGA